MAGSKDFIKNCCIMPGAAREQEDLDHKSRL